MVERFEIRLGFDVTARGGKVFWLLQTHLNLSVICMDQHALSHH
jgi:hypothetical protein